MLFPCNRELHIQVIVIPIPFTGIESRLDIRKGNNLGGRRSLVFDQIESWHLTKSYSFENEIILLLSLFFQLYMNNYKQRCITSISPRQISDVISSPMNEVGMAYVLCMIGYCIRGEFCYRPWVQKTLFHKYQKVLGQKANLKHNGIIEVVTFTVQEWWPVLSPLFENLKIGH